MKTGDRIRIINGPLYLGKWLKPGEEGVIETLARDSNYWWVKMDKDGKSYILAPDEFELVPFKTGEITPNGFRLPLPLEKIR